MNKENINLLEQVLSIVIVVDGKDMLVDVRLNVLV